MPMSVLFICLHFESRIHFSQRFKECFHSLYWQLGSKKMSGQHLLCRQFDMGFPDKLWCNGHRDSCTSRLISPSPTLYLPVRNVWASTDTGYPHVRVSSRTWLIRHETEGTEAEIQLPLKRFSRFQRLFPNPSWLVQGRASRHQKLAPTFPGIDSCLMVTKRDFLEMEVSLWLNERSQNVAKGWLST